MHPKTREKTKAVTRCLLELLALGAMFTVVGGFTRTPKGLGKLTEAVGQCARWRIRHALRRLRLQGYVTYDAEDETTPIVLTEKGLQRCIARGVLRTVQGKRWDHLWRVIIFDVPNKRKRDRNALQRNLQSLGFYQLQESVYVHPHDRSKLVTQLCSLLRVHPYVVFLTAASLGIFEKKVRRFFFDT